MTDARRFPETITFYTVMGIQAARRFSRVGGGWHLWVMANTLDEQGRGRIPRDLLKDYAFSLGVKPRTFQRWITEARNFDLVRDVQSANGEWMLVLAGLFSAAKSMRCENVGIKVAMSAADFIGKGWKARVWAAYEATHKGKPISREKMQKLVNVPVSTQRYRDAQAGVKRTRNYAKSDLKGDLLPAVVEYTDHKAPYVRGDGFIGWRLPDARTTDLVRVVGKGRARKANKKLRQKEQSGLLLMERALSDATSPAVIRLFNSTPAKRKATERKLARNDYSHVSDVYEAAPRATSGAHVWNHFPV